MSRRISSALDAAINGAALGVTLLAVSLFALWLVTP
jgi:hypothetical protein